MAFYSCLCTLCNGSKIISKFQTSFHKNKVKKNFFFCDNSPYAGASCHRERGVLSHNISCSLRDLIKENCNVLNKILLKALNEPIKNKP